MSEDNDDLRPTIRITILETVFNGLQNMVAVSQEKHAEAQRQSHEDIARLVAKLDHYLEKSATDNRILEEKITAHCATLYNTKQQVTAEVQRAVKAHEDKSFRITVLSLTLAVAIATGVAQYHQPYIMPTKDKYNVKE